MNDGVPLSNESSFILFVKRRHPFEGNAKSRDTNVGRELRYASMKVSRDSVNVSGQDILGASKTRVAGHRALSVFHEEKGSRTRTPPPLGSSDPTF